MAGMIPALAAAFTIGGLVTLYAMRRPARRCAVCDTDLSPVCPDRVACNRRAAENELEHAGR